MEPDAVASNRERVFSHIKRHPGIHLRQVCRDLGLAVGDVQYHIGRLERDGVVTSSRSGLYKRFYAGRIFGKKEGAILSALAQRTSRELLLHLIESPGASQERLAESLGLSPPSVSWNISRMMQLGLVERRRKGRFVSYTVAGDSEEIARFLRSYHPGVWDRWSSRLTDVVLALSDRRTPDL